MKHRGFCLHQGVDSVIEMSVTCLHVVYGPTGHFDGEVQALWIFTGESRQRFDGLGCALAVHRVAPVMIVFRTAIILKKMPFVKIQTGSHVLEPSLVPAAFDVA